MKNIINKFLNIKFLESTDIKSIEKKKSNNNFIKNIYFDNAGATPIDKDVLLAMGEVEDYYANPSGIYRSGVISKNIIEESRKSISRILNCDSSEIIFTGSGTESINLSLIGYVKNYVGEYKKLEKENLVNNKSGLAASIASSFENEDNILERYIIPKVITTNIEHSAVLQSLFSLEKEKLIEIIYLKVDETGRVRENDLREILKESGVENKNNIILVSMMYANNEVGRVQPVKEIGRIIDEYNRTNNKNLVFHIDAMQAGNYLDLDIKKLRAHMLSINGCKTYGPKGIGLLYKNKSIKISPITLGGGQESGMRSGTEDMQKIVGLAKALEISKEKRDTEIVRLLELQNYFLDNIILEIPEVKIYTHKNNVNKTVVKKDDLRGSEASAPKINYFNLESLPNNINIGLPGMLSDEMVVRLDYAGYDVSHKSACASNEVGEGSYVLRAMGHSEKDSNENIRVTIGRDTNLQNIKDLIIDIKSIYLKYKN